MAKLLVLAEDVGTLAARHPGVRAAGRAPGAGGGQRPHRGHVPRPGLGPHPVDRDPQPDHRGAPALPGRGPRPGRPLPVARRTGPPSTRSPASGRCSSRSCATCPSPRRPCAAGQRRARAVRRRRRPGLGGQRPHPVAGGRAGGHRAVLHPRAGRAEDRPRGAPAAAGRDLHEEINQTRQVLDKVRSDIAVAGQDATLAGRPAAGDRAAANRLVELLRREQEILARARPPAWREPGAASTSSWACCSGRTPSRPRSWSSTAASTASPTAGWATSRA